MTPDVSPIITQASPLPSPGIMIGMNTGVRALTSKTPVKAAEVAKWIKVLAVNQA